MNVGTEINYFKTKQKYFNFKTDVEKKRRNYPPEIISTLL